MKKYNHPTDDFLRETFKDHQMVPSDAARKTFLKDALQLPPAKKKGRSGLILLSVFIAFVGMGIVFWFSDTQITESLKVKKVENIQQQQQQQQVGTEDIQPQQQHVRAEYFRSQQNRSSLLSISPVLSDTGATTSSADTNNEPSHLSQVTAIVKNDIPVNFPETITDTTPGIKIPDSMAVPVSRIKQKSQDVPGKNGKFMPSIGVYYTPEWMFNTLEGTKFVNNFGLEGTFHFGRFSVRTGIGLSINKGTNELIVAYNDFLGSYNKLDSMEFTWNNPSQQYIPKFYMTPQDVWDSLMKLDYARVVKRYTYIQIPMIMGYDFWQSDRIDFGVRVGPVMSILVASRQLSAAYDPGNKRIISINDISPGQVSLNWQAMAGLNTSIHLTNEVQFEIEPSIRYYFNSVYEKPVPLWKPWSISIRAAFVVKL